MRLLGWIALDLALMAVALLGFLPVLGEDHPSTTAGILAWSALVALGVLLLLVVLLGRAAARFAYRNGSTS